jgi:hypothetical protein
LALTGRGAFSADAALGLTPLWTPAFAWIALAVGLAGGAANRRARRPAPAAEPVAASADAAARNDEDPACHPGRAPPFRHHEGIHLTRSAYRRKRSEADQG